MALVTCYDTDGNPHQKEPVDARECCKHCGYTMSKAVPVAADGTLSEAIHGDGTGEALPEINQAQQDADHKVREAARLAQVVTPDPAPEKRAYHRKAKE